MDLNSILTVIGIVSPFILAAVWMATLITKTSNRALLLEVAVRNHDERVIKLEAITSHTAIEQTVEKICHRVFESKEFKGFMGDSIKDIMLHIENNRSHAQAGAFEEILIEIKRLHAEVIGSQLNSKNHRSV